MTIESGPSGGRGAGEQRTSPAEAGSPRSEMDPVTMVQAGRRFGSFVAVESLTLSIPRATILGLIGPSGSGKTTTVRMLTGALRPTRGDVWVLGEQPAHFRRQTRERIGYMPQQFVLYPDLSAHQNVGFVGSLFGMLWRRRRRRTREVLELVDLWDVRNRRASQLSGGMQRRLELACALVHEPSLLFLDEPTAGIDPILRQRVWSELRRLRDSGATLLVTTQYVGEAEYCDDVALLSEGRLIGLAPPDDLRRQALGGEVIEIETNAPFDAETLRSLPGVRAVRQRNPHDAFVIVDDAGAATPTVVETLGGMNVDVASSREYRPTFDEVFAELVTRDRARLEGGREPAREAGRPQQEREGGEDTPASGTDWDQGNRPGGER